VEVIACGSDGEVSPARPRKAVTAMPNVVELDSTQRLQWSPAGGSTVLE
jgi:hypothetical protein